MQEKRLLGGRSAGAYVILAAAVLYLAALVGWIVYASIYSYFNAATLVFTVLAVACAVAAFIAERRSLSFLRLAAVVFAVLGFAFFAYMSMPVWQDELSGFKMYGSRGTLAPVIALFVLFLVGCIIGIVSCFMKEKEKTANV